MLCIYRSVQPAQPDSGAASWSPVYLAAPPEESEAWELIQVQPPPSDPGPTAAGRRTPQTTWIEIQSRYLEKVEISQRIKHKYKFIYQHLNVSSSFYALKNLAPRLKYDRYNKNETNLWYPSWSICTQMFCFTLCLNLEKTTCKGKKNISAPPDINKRKQCLNSRGRSTLTAVAHWSKQTILTFKYSSPSECGHENNVKSNMYHLLFQ